ncbi:hypothetical protein PR048_018417 [Dryococelus australis]|uniref:UDP-glucose 4-epimerase n=1 Tax=Dryococelus australis TaxID=614101 RepID=A0ABQ9HCC8_9NEOP|nr:hypothetical protein PR048_018417 [Dryococelus australis]
MPTAALKRLTQRIVLQRFIHGVFFKQLVYLFWSSYCVCRTCADCSDCAGDDEASPLTECLRRVQEIAGKTLTFYPVDIMDRSQLDKVFSSHKIDYVMHFAALKAVGESVEKPLLYYKNNVGGSVTLLEVMKDHNVKKLIYSSSATVYGTPQKLPLTEDHPTGVNCTNPYGKSKYFVEEILKDLVASDKVVQFERFGERSIAESKDRGNDRPSRKPLQPAASSRTAPTCENPGVIRLGIQPSSFQWEWEGAV